MVELDGTPVKAEDARGYHLLNLQFHERLVEMAGNRKLSAIYRKLIKELSLFRRLNLADGWLMPISAGEHRAIVKAIAAGDAEAAGRAMFDHVMESKERTVTNNVRRPPTPAKETAPPKAEPTLSVNGRTYRLPAPGAPPWWCAWTAASPTTSPRPWPAAAHALAGAHAGAGHRPGGRLRGAQLHQPQQPVDRDRRAAQRARHLRQLPLRHRLGHRGDDERPEVAARAHHAGGPGRGGPSSCAWSPPRTSCAACSATACRGHLLLSEKADKVHLAENGIDRRAGLVGRPVPDVYSAPSCRSSCSPPASS
jgi:hypothetical protein